MTRVIHNSREGKTIVTESKLEMGPKVEREDYLQNMRRIFWR